MRLLKSLRIGNKQLSCIRNLSAVSAESSLKNSVKVARTSVTNPRDHTPDQYGMWYTIEPSIVNRLFTHGGLTKAFKEVTEVFGETSIMIREPAITTIDYLKKSKLQNRPNKFLLYGRNGIGKTMSLAHIIHYLHEEEFIIIHTRAPSLWSSNFREIVPSLTREGFYDHTIDASMWLTHFQQQNAAIVENLGLVTTEPYTWTKRETTEAGSPLMSLVEFGISRARYASECAYYLNSELKIHANEGRAKVACVFEGINALFAPTSKFLREDKTAVPTNLFTLHQAFLQMLNNDWKNGCIVGSVDVTMSTKDRRKSLLPRYLLRKEGWDKLDPFVPIKVDNYTDIEFHSAVDYYLERQFLQHPAARTPEGREELEFMSGKVPAVLLKISLGH